MAHRTLKLSLTSRTFRAYMAERKRIPPNLFRYLGYALLIGHT